MEIANKRVGETPLELIKRLHPNSKKRYTYAGRLDPLASGLMIILEGDEVHAKEQYLALGKTYQLEVLFGISTDSYDPLGLITKLDLSPDITKQDLQDAVANYQRTYEQPYPPYSSKTVQGKPLWWWAREDKLAEIKIPTREVTLHSLTLNSYRIEPLHTLIPQIISNIQLVNGDFRQSQIISTWRSLLTDPLTHRHTNMPIASLTVSCSSGTYMRSLANDIGKQLNTPAIALSITRTKVGDYSI